MREVAGLGYEEIAGACELTADAVRSRIHRTRLQLRDLTCGADRHVSDDGDNSLGKTSMRTDQ